MVYRTGPKGDLPINPPGPSTIDLHTHTRRSDGVLEPGALVAAASIVGVRQLAITDHDTLAGYLDGRSAATAAGVDLIPGVEINTVADDADGFHEGELHLMGYGMDPQDSELAVALAGQRHWRRERFDRMVRRLAELGLPIDDALEQVPLADEDSLGRPTVARALVAKGLATSVDDAFRRLLSRGRPAYVPRLGLGPKDATQAIVRAGGLAVLAHFGEGPARPEVVRELRDLGVRGLEVWYRGFGAETVERLAALAVELRLVSTGGSDYHGDHETYAEAHAALWVPPAVGAGLTDALSDVSILQ
ncbi:MAG TPA: PHP domain-containing protein [Candidatus Saccharimonadales bacterium]|nr:PHP domain-containing protein [Candidatus Saccharimonadales bacterium]